MGDDGRQHTQPQPASPLVSPHVSRVCGGRDEANAASALVSHTDAAAGSVLCRLLIITESKQPQRGQEEEEGKSLSPCLLFSICRDEPNNVTQPRGNFRHKRFLSTFKSVFYCRYHCLVHFSHCWQTVSGSARGTLLRSSICTSGCGLLVNTNRIPPARTPSGALMHPFQWCNGEQSFYFIVRPL